MHSWSRGNKRDFLWRSPRCSPYVVLISEMLLRKTKAETVDRVIRPFFKKYPNPKKLANASTSEVIKTLKPLGLHRMRGKAIKVIGKRLSSIRYKRFLKDYDNIISLPHVGRYVANAVLCLSYGKQTPMVDANIVRLMNRVFGIRRPVEVHKADKLWDFVAELIPRGKACQYNMAMLDFGALVCTPRSPKCGICPLTSICRYGSGGRRR